MITPEQGLFTRLTGNGVVGQLIGARCYPLKAPQSVVRPFVVYRRISGNPERHMLGACELASVRMQVDAIADHYIEARGLADAIRSCLDGFRGDVVVGAGALSIRNVILESDHDEFIDPTTGSDDGVYLASQDFQIFYALPLPTL